MLIYIVSYHLVVLVKLKEINKKCSLLYWIQSDQNRWIFFVAWIAFEFELKGLTDLEFHANVVLINIVFYHLLVFVKLEEIDKNVVWWIEFSQTKIEIDESFFFFAWIAFEFESKVLTVVEFYDRILLIYIVFYHLFVFVKSEEM